MHALKLIVFWLMLVGSCLAQSSSTISLPKGPPLPVSDGDITIGISDLVDMSDGPVHERTVELDGIRYVVIFKICSNCMITVPATLNGQPHYDAAIRIYIETGDDQHSERTLFYGPFNGEWTEKGCFEDDPKSLVERAMFEKAKKQPN